MDDRVKAFADAVPRDKSLIYQWLADPKHDPYTRMVSVLNAAHKVNPAGADLYVTDFQARHEALRSTDLFRAMDWNVVLSEAMLLTQSALAEAVTKGAETEMKVTLAIRALKELLIQHKAVQ